jgi:hypothetical protein
LTQNAKGLMMVRQIDAQYFVVFFTIAGRLTAQYFVVFSSEEKKSAQNFRGISEQQWALLPARYSV